MTKESWKSVRLGGAFIVLAALAAYHNSFSVPFLFDDGASITENGTIRHLWPIWDTLSPPQGGATVSGRPMVNLSLAVNYAFGGTVVWGYHALNLAIHILAGLTLFGVVRRTLLQPTLCGRFGAVALPLALATAVLWTVHPLQTESVTYVAQRTESLMGLFYLLTLYCFIRGAASPVPRIWYSLSVMACLLGMASKEVMVSAPLMALLYDRTFLSGSFRKAWSRSWRLYLALGSTWVLLGYLVVGTGNRGETAGFGTGIASWAYALTQFRVIVHYLGLSIWPHPLVLDYGIDLAKHAAEVVPYALIVALLMVATVISLWRWPAIGFAGVWFFAILAPTSSVVTVATETMAEHRMYLPLAAVVVLGVMGIHALVGRRSVSVCLVLAVGLGFLTVQRNEDYCSELAIWSDTVAKRPSNPRAHLNLGNALFDLGKVSDAIEQYEQALRIKRDYLEAQINLGNALFELGKVSEAIRQYEQALRIRPDYAKPHNNIGIALVSQGRVAEAIAEFAAALRIEPDYAEVHYNLGVALANQGSISEAIAQYRETLRLKPDWPPALSRLAWILATDRNASLRNGAEAVQLAERLCEITGYPEAHYNLGVALANQGRISEAIAQYRETLRLKPDWPPALSRLAWILATDRNASLRNGAEAVQSAERLCEITGHRQDDALDALAAAYAEVGRFSDAIQVAQKAVELANAAGHRDLAGHIQERLKSYQAGSPYREGSALVP
jgi:tetratricopeptide (TPR) repeat protein